MTLLPPVALNSIAREASEHLTSLDKKVLNNSQSALS
jgi:hypothetical protein